VARFKDHFGRDWDVEINVAQIKRVKNRLGHDIGKLEGDRITGLLSILEDPILLCDTLFVLCEQQAKDRGINDEQFGESLQGDAILEAQEKLLEAFANFYPSQSRPLFATLVQKLKNLRSVAIQAAGREIEKASTKAEADLLKSVTGSPESSGSTPTRSPSES
jgi:hypothetical protein